MSHKKSILVLVFGIIIFNLQTALFIYPPMNDDPQRYYDALLGKYQVNYLDYHYLHHYIKYCLIHLMVYSAVLAKIANVCLLVLPSILFYNLLSRIFSLPSIISVTALLLVNSAPGQVMIPTSIESSYTVYGLTFLLGSWILGYYYLISQERLKQLFFLCGSIILSYISADSLGQSILFLPSLAIFILAIQSTYKKKLVLLFFIIASILQRFFQILYKPSGNEKLNNIEYDVIIDRVKDFFEFSIFLPYINKSFWDIYWSVIVILTGILMFFTIKRMSRLNITPNKPWLSDKYNIQSILLFALSWTIISITPLILFNQVFRPRYGYLSSYGINLIIALMFYVLFSRFTNKTRFILMLSICLFSGFLRWSNIKSHSQIYNSSYKKISRLFEKKSFPIDSQIVLIGNLYPKARYYKRANGLLTFISGRKDITGLLPTEYHFYNAFRSKVNKSPDMAGISLNKPLFIFREGASATQEFEQLDYALQWYTNPENLDQWKIYKLDKTTGEMLVKQSNIGMKSFEKELTEMNKSGIKRCDIIWAGCQY